MLDSSDSSLSSRLTQPFHLWREAFVLHHHLSCCEIRQVGPHKGDLMVLDHAPHCRSRDLTKRIGRLGLCHLG